MPFIEPTSAGTWVAHPGLIPIAMTVFNEHMPLPNQIASKREHRRIKARDLLDVPKGIPVSAAGLRGNINVSLLYASLLCFCTSSIALTLRVPHIDATVTLRRG